MLTKKNRSSSQLSHNYTCIFCVPGLVWIWVPMFLGAGADCRQYSLSDFLIMHQASQYFFLTSVSTLALLCLSLTDQFALKGIN